MKRLILFIALLLAFQGLIAPGTGQAAERQKATIILAFVNNAKTTYDDEISARVIAALNKKVDGIYNVNSSQAYLERLNKLGIADISTAERQSLVDAVEPADVDYLVLAELEPFVRKEKITVFTYGKDMTATLLLKIIDVKNNKSIYNGKFIEKASDSTTDGLIGNKSVAMMAIDRVVYQAGEVISFRLPLCPAK